MKMQPFRKATIDERQGTSGKTVLRTSYAQLVEALGEPHMKYTAGKTQVEWAFFCEVGDGHMVVTIYDYKSDEPLDLETSWHIGGKGMPMQFEWVEKMLEINK